MTLATKEAYGLNPPTESGETPPPVTAAMPLYRRLEPFEGDGSAWPVYEEQVYAFFRVNDTPEQKQQKVFLTSCGTRVFSVLLDLFNPATPHDKTLSELLATLRAHFSPAPSTLMEHFRFNHRSRREGDTLGQFVTVLRGLASACAFEGHQRSLVHEPGADRDIIEKLVGQVWLQKMPSFLEIESEGRLTQFSS